MSYEKPGSLPGALMAAEIAEQPEVLARQFDRQWGAIREAAAAIRAAAPRFILLAGRGTSDHAALYLKYLLEVRLGLPCGLASLSTLTGYGARPELGGVLWVCVSQSGGSPDAIESTLAAARAGALTLAITNDPESALAQAAALQIFLDAGEERSVAATKTFTASLQAAWLLVEAWYGGDASAVRPAPQALARAATPTLISELTDRYRFIDRLVTVGRGYSYPIAREGALKLMETAYVAAHAFSGADLMHGPLAMIDQQSPVIVVASGEVGSRLLRPVLERLRERGADTCLIGDAALAAEVDPSVYVELPTGLPEDLAPLVQIPPLQQLARCLAVARQLDPDHPRALHKVTRTL